MSSLYLHGRNPLQEAIRSPKSGLIEEIYLTPQAETDGRLIGLLQKHNLKHHRVTSQEIESMVGKEANHQGVCARIKESRIFSSLEDALTVPATANHRLFVLLDELEDPHNVGAIIRSALAFGATAILVPEHNQAPINGTVIKTSAGAIFSLPIVRIGNINTTLRQLQEKGFWVYGLTGDGDTPLESVTFDTDAVFVVGSEGQGIREKTLGLCDFKLSIAINEKAESLNASNATAVALYEWNKQQRA